MRWNTGTSGWTVLALSASVLFGPTALGVNYVVDGLNGDDLNGGVSATGGASDLAGLDFSDAFKTIGQATSVTAPGDFIFVNAGAYPEPVVPTNRTTLIAVGEAILGNGLSRAVEIITPAGEVTLDGFTIENADRGVSVFNTSGIRIRNLTIKTCGTGIFVNTAAAKIRRCVVTDCTMRRDGARLQDSPTGTTPTSTRPRGRWSWRVRSTRCSRRSRRASMTPTWPSAPRGRPAGRTRWPRTATRSV